ncbi:rna-directed dna polymerase from mobile element jockey-like [Limosa lapponica baueri]|uniref:Rna-directed dna polymerase from mobile element jockey-like n=1 Tax=Limosa lapponica baueri TaxID=1758121 RepID=A0A2I0TN19_LIMLA|nr:rna-directed dna polymerase from mobile element jockey-like [Limosa lapponica baueri]
MSLASERDYSCLLKYHQHCSGDDIRDSTLSKFADDTELGGVATTPDGCAAIQRDLCGLEKWAKRNLTKFDRGKCKILSYLRRSNCIHPYTRLGTDWLGKTLAEKDLEGSGGHQVEHEPARTGKANSILDCIGQSIEG